MKKFFWLFILSYSLNALEVSIKRIFSSLEKAEIWIYAPPTGKLFIRIYQIEDPLNFLKDQASGHSISIKRQRRANRGSTMWHSFAENLRYSFYSLARRYMKVEHREAMRKFFHIKSYAYPFSDYYPEKNLFPALAYPIVREWEYPLNKPGRWSHRLILEPLAANFYLVEVSHGRKIAHVPLIVSDIAMLVKEGLSSRFVYVFDPKTGEAISEAELFIFSKNLAREKLELTSSLVVKNGIYYEKDSFPLSSQENLYVARVQNHFALSDIYFYNRLTNPFKAAILTDRPVYRQGQEINIKGYIFEKNDFHLQPYKGTIELSVIDPDEKKIFSSKLQTKEVGEYSLSFFLPPDALLGMYSIRLQVRGNEEYGHFYVEQYRKSEFQVKVESEKKMYFSQETAKVIISANYYSGEPLRNTPVYYEIIRKKKEYPPWRNFAYAWYYEDVYYDEAKELIADGELKTNEEGMVSLNFSVFDFGDSDAIYEVVAEVRGKTRETIKGKTTIFVPRAEFRLEIIQDRWYYETLEKMNFTVEAHSYLSEASVQDILVTVELWQKLWYPQEKEIKIAESQLKLNEFGKALGNFTLPKESGNYELRAWAFDSQKRKTESKVSFWIWSSLGGFAQTEKEIKITPDKLQYDPTETIKLNVQSDPKIPKILLVFEGEDIYGYDFLDGKQNTFFLPIREEFMPNFTISAHAISENVIYYGSREIIIPPKNKFLQIQIFPDKPKYLPKEKAHVVVKIFDHQNKPVRANFSLAVVDEAIFAIRSPQFTNLGQVFYPRRSHYVNSSDSLSFRFYNFAENVSLYSKIAENRERFLGEFKAMAKREEAFSIRRDFRDTAYFLASGYTDESGSANVEFSFPDNLTSWRITVHAATSKAQFGSQSHNVVVAKDFAIRLAQPRFLREGDYAVIGLVLQNHYPEKLKAQLSAKVLGAELAQKVPPDVDILPKAEIRLDLPLIVPKESNQEKVKVEVTAQTKMESDALETELPILPKGAAITQSEQKLLTGDEKRGQIVLEVNNPKPKIFRLFVSSGVMGSIEEALPQLIHYPYGCVEQTLSTFVPLQLALQVSQKLNLPLGIDPNEVKKVTQAGLSKLYHYQHSDGGWGWWDNDDTNPYMTAYVLDALNQAKLANVHIDPDVISQGISALRELLNLRELRLEEKLYAILVLSLYENPTKESLNFIKSYLSSVEAKPYFLALLSQHLARLGYSKLHEEALEALKKFKKENPQGIYFAQETPTSFVYYEDPQEITAQALLAFAKAPKIMDLWGKDMVRWLLAQKRQKYWTNTRTSALVIRALGEYALYSREKRETGKIKIKINNEEIHFNLDPGKSQNFTWQKKSLENRFQIDFERTTAGFAQIRSEVTFYEDNPKIRKDYFNLTHQYYRLEKYNENNQIYFRLSKNPKENFQVGDLVASVSQLKTKNDVDYVLYEEFHPAGFERAGEISALILDESQDLINQPAGLNLFDERTAISKTFLPKNQTWRILQVFRAQYPGKYYSGFNSGGMMYYPEYNSLSQGKLIAIAE